MAEWALLRDDVPVVCAYTLVAVVLIVGAKGTTNIVAWTIGHALWVAHFMCALSHKCCSSGYTKLAFLARGQRRPEWQDDRQIDQWVDRARRQCNASRACQNGPLRSGHACRVMTRTKEHTIFLLEGAHHHQCQGAKVHPSKGASPNLRRQTTLTQC